MKKTVDGINKMKGLIKFNNGFTNAIAYKWDFGDGKFSTEFEPTMSISPMALTATKKCCFYVSEETVILIFKVQITSVAMINLLSFAFLTKRG